jgi:hypothetical protein
LIHSRRYEDNDQSHRLSIKQFKKKVRKKATSTNDDWTKIAKKVFMSSRLLIETRIIVIMSSSFAVRLEETKNRKITFVVFFFSRIVTSEEKKKNREVNLVNFSLDQTLSSFFLTISFVESSFAIQLFFLLLILITLKKFAIMSKVLLNDILNSIKIRCDADFFNRVQDLFFSFELSLCFIFFVSLSFILSIFSSFFSLSRSRKKTRLTFSTSFMKKIKFANHYECILSIKWFDDFKKTRCFIILKSVEHFLERFYYFNKQICLKHINQLKRLFKLLSIKNLIEMKNVLWKLLKFEKEVEIFKIDRSNLFEISTIDD